MHLRHVPRSTQPHEPAENMIQYRIVASCLGLAVLIGACGDGPVVDGGLKPPPLNGTAFIDPDVLTMQDPTALRSVTPLGAGSRDMYDVRVGNTGTYDVWLFRAEFDDVIAIELQVNAEFDSVSAVELADLYGSRLGVLPNILRQGVASVSIHDGDETFLAVDDGLIVHAIKGATYRDQGYLEEVLAHEAVHVSLDPAHASSPGWLAAQESDPGFISGFAQDYPEVEDLAETFGVWLAARWAGDGITGFLRAVIENAVPARLEYLDAQNFQMYPILD